MAEVYLVKNLTCLEPADDPSRDYVEKLRFGQAIRATVVVPRNYEFHKKAMALVSLVAHNSDWEFEQLRKYVTVRAGYVDEYHFPDIEARVVTPKSWSFASMDDVEFHKFFERILDVMIKEIVPHIPVEELRSAVEMQLVTA